MKKKIGLLAVSIICMCCAGCNDRAYDYINIYNKKQVTTDDINIKIKNGYFYDSHEKFTVDENTIGVTIYFSNNDDDW